MQSCSKVGSVQGNAPTELPLPERIQVVINHRDGARYRSLLDDHWRGAELGITTRIRHKLERQLEKCGSGVERS
ncbi:Hypothetical protein PMT_2765 [Prochlorococcus marinus str. MIT 9313]|uniref:Uncharacterized protein n=1 Tax=Prochlorococcus marinus (strain MIT 9313) TaxID=74547 RepID=B9ESE2_PROMM|nr:hypothetical protein [Prochlorococcus marinus]CAX32286.1 Hypothetical protein PMT_2765 [Prochlorococcus marinus str. MIT 9313]